MSEIANKTIATKNTIFAVNKGAMVPLGHVGPEPLAIAPGTASATSRFVLYVAYWN
jgi:hypothetical protein